MRITPDELIYWQHGWVKLNATILITWGLMLFMAVGSWLVTRKLSADVKIPRWQNILEMLVVTLQTQLAESGLHQPEKYLGFLGTLFLFIAVSALATILPGYEPPTSSLSTTGALAMVVFFAVPFYGVAACGWRGYLKEYLQPTPLMLPFNVIGDFSRTIALAVRLFGNAMSGTMLLGILVALAPLIFPILMHSLDLLTGMVQAYIFTILATVYVAAGTRSRAK